jgi:hypothetical protein
MLKGSTLVAQKYEVRFRHIAQTILPASFMKPGLIRKCVITLFQK